MGLLIFGVISYIALADKDSRDYAKKNLLGFALSCGFIAGAIIAVKELFFSK